MIVLDTDHISILQHTKSPAAQTLSERLAESADRELATTVVTVEEQMRSWLGLIARYRDAEQQATYYERLIRFVRFFNTWRILSLDQTAISELTRLRKSKVRVASTDQKIAAIKPAEGEGLTAEQTRQREQYIQDALGTLRPAIAAGWKDFAHLRKDNDLKPLRGLPEFEALFPK